MDANKLIALRTLEYNIARVCSNCVYGKFSLSQWGTCQNQQISYHHKKHTQSQRQLSIHKTGHCAFHEWDPKFKDTIHSYREFMDSRKPTETNEPSEQFTDKVHTIMSEE